MGINDLIRRNIWTMNEEDSASFNINELKNIRSFAGRKKYVESHLPRIATGSGRAVYDMGDKVLKLAKNPKGIAQNEVEAQLGQNDYYAKNFVTEVFEFDEDDHQWVIAEKGKKLTPNRFKQITGVKLSDLDDFLRNFDAQNNGRQGFGQDKELEAELWENEFSSGIIDFMSTYDMDAGDLGRISSYGEVVRDGQPEVVLTDYGLNRDVWQQHYERRLGEAENNFNRELKDNPDTSNMRDGGYGGWALLPNSVSQGGINNDNDHYDTTYDRSMGSEVMTEGMKDHNNLALGINGNMYYLYDKRIDNVLNSFDVDEAEEYVLGGMGLIPNKEFGGYEIDTIHAKDGYGPLLHLIAMSLSGNNGVIPSREAGSISDEGKNVWKEFDGGKGAPYIKDAIPLPEVHPEPYLNKKYITSQPIDTYPMYQNFQNIVSNDPNGERETFALELANDMLNNAMQGLHEGFKMNMPIGKIVSELKEWDDYSKINSIGIEKAVEYIDGLDHIGKSLLNNISPLYKNYMVSSQNIDKSLEITDDDVGFFYKLMKVQELLKNFGLIKEDLVYWGVDGTADPESDNYEIGPETLTEDLNEENINECDNYFDFNSLNDYVEFDKPLYSIIAKRKTAKLHNMQPKQYIYKLAYNWGLSYDDVMIQVNDEKVNKYSEMMKSGSKAPIGYFKRNGEEQEGRHRALAAMKLNCKTIPVVELIDISNIELDRIVNKFKDMSFEDLDGLFKKMGFKNGITNLGYNDLTNYIRYNLNEDSTSLYRTEHGSVDASDNKSLEEDKTIVSKEDIPELEDIFDDYVGILSPHQLENNERNNKASKILKGLLNKFGFKYITGIGEWDDDTDTHEQSYIIKKPENIEPDDFHEIIAMLSSKFDQDAYIYGGEGDYNLYFNNGETKHIGSSIAFDDEEYKSFDFVSEGIVDENIGYKVMPFDGKNLISGSDHRQTFPLEKNGKLNMTGNGIYLSPNKDYVLQYYSGLSDSEVLLTLEYNSNEIITGDLNDREPEISVPSARIVDYEILNSLSEGSINEAGAGISRLMKHMKEKDFAIISANRNEYDREQNRLANNNLSSELQSKQAGFINLIGHWEEIKKGNQTGTVDVREQSFFIPKPDSMQSEEFQNWIIQLGNDYGQEAVLIGEPINPTVPESKINAKLHYMDGRVENKGKPDLINIGKAYSQLRKKPDATFVFGEEEALHEDYILDNINESLIGLSSDDYKRISDDDIIDLKNLFNEFQFKRFRKEYFTGHDIDDVLYLYNSIQLNYNRFLNLWGDKLNEATPLIVNLLKQHGFLKESRDMSYMPGTTVPKIKKSCMLGGNADGTSEPCSQGDAGAVSYEKLDENNENVVSPAKLKYLETIFSKSTKKPKMIKDIINFVRKNGYLSDKQNYYIKYWLKHGTTPYPKGEMPHNIREEESINSLIKEVINDVEEGVGDKFAQRRFNIPDEEEEFNRKYRASKEEEFVVKDNIWNLVKNPKRPSNFESGVRGVIDKYGNLYLEDVSLNYLHTDIVEILINEGLLNNENIWWRKEPREFLTVQRDGNSNNIKLGESNKLFGLSRNSSYDATIRDGIDVPSIEEVDAAFKTFLKRANLKNPQWNFPLEKIVDKPPISVDPNREVMMDSDVEEGVGDKFLQNKGVMPDEEQEFNQQYNLNNSEEIIADISMYEDQPNYIVKNPKNLRNLKCDVRGIIDSGGNLYTQTRSDDDQLHDSMIFELDKLNLVKFDKNWHKKLPNETGYLTVQRNGCSNDFVVGESNILYGEFPQKKGFVNQETKPYVDAQFHKFLDKAVQINSKLSFPHRKLYDTTEMEEGVGDKFLQNKGIVPDKEQEFNREYNVQQEEEIVYKDRIWNLIKNPKRPSNFQKNARGVIDKYGNLYLQDKTSGTHDLLIDALIEKRLINTEENWWLKEPREFLTVHRNGDTNEIRFGESNLLFGYDKENKYKDIINDIDLPPMKNVDLAFSTFMKRAQQKNPNWKFPLKKINESIENIVTNVINETYNNILVEEKVEYGALMLEFNSLNWNEFIDNIKEEDLYDDGSGTFGKEKQQHITILYGFHKKVNGNDFNKIINKYDKPIDIELKNISLFENPEFDVVKMDVKPSKELSKLRKEVEDFPSTLTFKEFHPHMTIAYVKKGEGKKYIKRFKKIIKLKSNLIIYSDVNKNKKKFFIGDNKKQMKSKNIVEKIVTNVINETYKDSMNESTEEPIDIVVSRTEVSRGSGSKNIEVRVDHTPLIKDDLKRPDFTINEKVIIKVLKESNNINEIKFKKIYTLEEIDNLFK